MNIEFHFDFGSPNAYLVHKVIPTITKDTGVHFQYVPVLLGGVFKATNNVAPGVSLAGIKNKPEYQRIETERFCRAHGIKPQVANPYFPVNTLKIMRGAVFAEKTDFCMTYIDALYSAMWEQSQKMDEDDIIRRVLDQAGLPTEDILAGMSDSTMKQTLIDNTEKSVARGTFGSPTLFVGDDIYFGKDKLREAVEAARAKG